jgi:hypothetical protein
MEVTGIAPVFGAEFAYYFARHWGVSLGAGVSWYSIRLMTSGITLDNAARILILHDETLRATYIGIPLLVQFRTPVFSRHTFHAAAGGRLDLAVAGRYRVSSSRRLAVAGSTVETFENSGSVSFRPGVSLLAETGICWALGGHWGIYTGAYAGYGLSDVLPAASSDAPQGLGTGSLLNLRNRKGAPYVEDIHLLQVGARIKAVYSF